METMVIIERIKNSYNYFSIVVIVGLIIALVFCRECGRGHPDTSVSTYTDTVLVVETIYDTNMVYKTKDTLIPVYYNVPDVIPSVSDTPSLIYHHFADVYYSDTAVDDDKMFIWIGDTISQNHLKHRTIKYKDRTPTEIVQNVVNVNCENKIKVFAGVGLGVSPTLDTYKIEPKLMLLTKQDNLYGVGYDLRSGIVSFDIMWKLRFKK